MQQRWEYRVAFAFYLHRLDPSTSASPWRERIRSRAHRGPHEASEAPQPYPHHHAAARHCHHYCRFEVQPSPNPALARQWISTPCSAPLRARSHARIRGIRGKISRRRGKSPAGANRPPTPIKGRPGPSLKDTSSSSGTHPLPSSTRARARLLFLLPLLFPSARSVEPLSPRPAQEQGAPASGASAASLSPPSSFSPSVFSPFPLPTALLFRHRTRHESNLRALPFRRIISY